MRFLKSYGLAFLILLGIAAWMLSGTLIQGGRGPGEGERPMIEAIEGEDGPLRGFFERIGLVGDEPEQEVIAASVAEQQHRTARTQVRVTRFTADDMPMIVELRGRTQANAQVAARAETSGIVKQVHVARGQRVAPGDLLCTLDQGTRLARAASAEARLEQARAELENNQQLRSRGVSAPNTARQFEVAARAAQADYDEAVAELDRTEIRAEVGGIVQDPLADSGASLSLGGECATIVQLDPMLFVGEVPEARVGLLAEGEEAHVRTVTGAEVEGAVRFVSSTADPATRSFRVEIVLPNSDGAIRDGLTASATIEVGATSAHLVPQSVLTLDDDGVLGVRAVEADETVAFHRVEILRDTREGVWVAGLPETVEIITVGQEFVRSGQAVSASRAEAEPAS